MALAMKVRVLNIDTCRKLINKSGELVAHNIAVFLRSTVVVGTRKVC